MFGHFWLICWRSSRKVIFLPSFSRPRTIKSEGQIKSTIIDKKKLIDTHYGAIAAKAVTLKPKDLTVQEKSQEEFEKQLLGLGWMKVFRFLTVFEAAKRGHFVEFDPGNEGRNRFSSMS